MWERFSGGSCVLESDRTHGLPDEIVVVERGWLSANNIVFKGGRDGAAIVDTGYSAHAVQTSALVGNCLNGEPLARILNTHLHSDHCGGNAILQAEYPGSITLIPPGLASHVRHWDPVALSYTPTGQHCPEFGCDGVLQPGSSIRLGRRDWEIHAAPGHDPHSIILFEPRTKTLISADALWQNGFGIVFPELDGNNAFDEVDATLALIDRLAPETVIPGHGTVFHDVDRAIFTARERLAAFVRNPRKHARHAIKVLLKFKLLEVQRIELNDFMAWASAMPYVHQIHRLESPDTPCDLWLTELCRELCRLGAAEQAGTELLNR